MLGLWRREPAPLRWVRRCDGPAPLVVALHGYGADASQIETLLPLQLEARAHVVAPQAFLTVRDGGRAWFPVGVRDGQPHIEEVALGRALERLDLLLGQLRARCCGPADPVVVVGYSQGAVLILEALLRGRRLPFERAAAFAGTASPRPSVAPHPSPIPVFLADGIHDVVVSERERSATVAALRQAGHHVTHRVDPVPHVVSRAALRALRPWLAERLSLPSPNPGEPKCPPPG